MLMESPDTCFKSVHYVYCMNFKKESFRHVVLNDLRNVPLTAPIACANFSPETYNQNYKITKKSFKK